MTFTDDKTEDHWGMSHLWESTTFCGKASQGDPFPPEHPGEGHPELPGHRQDFDPRRTLPPSRMFAPSPLRGETPEDSYRASQGKRGLGDQGPQAHHSH